MVTAVGATPSSSVRRAAKVARTGKGADVARAGKGADVARAAHVARTGKVARSAHVAKTARTEHSPYRKLLWFLSAFVGVEVVVAIILTLLLVLPNKPDLVAGLSTRNVVVIEAILFLSGLMSGLSGFRFS